MCSSLTQGENVQVYISRKESRQVSADKTDILIHMIKMQSTSAIWLSSVHITCLKANFTEKRECSKFVETLQNDSQTMSSQASNVRQSALLEV
jgi:precorrin-4 methylase